MALKKNKLLKSNKLHNNCSYTYKKILGLLIKKGLKSKAKSILDFALFKVSSKLKSSPKIVLLKIFLKLNTFVEVRKIRLRKRLVFVPFYISYSRRLFLIAKWLVMATSSNKQKIPFSEKLSTEILNILTLKNSKAVSFKLLNIKQALKNRSNTHYRW